VGDGLDEEEQLKAQKGTQFIPFSQFPPKKLRKDCSYHSTPAMVTPRHLENLHSCEVSREIHDNIQDYIYIGNTILFMLAGYILTS
jgi:hypothetical protein